MPPPWARAAKGALKRLAEVEALARTNLRAAEEARRVLEAERALLEEEAGARSRAERTASGLRRELEQLRSTEEQRAAQARFAATQKARTELESEMERVHDEHSRVVDELDRMRGTLFDHDSLLDEYSQRLHDEQEAQAIARAELVRAEEAARAAERNLEIALETARRRAEDDHARLVKVEEQLRDTTVERDRATTELRSLTEGDGEIARLRAQAAATHEDMTRALADLDVQAARADKAEAELATTKEANIQAERLAAEATEARDLAGIDLETTRRELAERNELLDMRADFGPDPGRRPLRPAHDHHPHRRERDRAGRRARSPARCRGGVARRRDDPSAEAAEQLEHAAADVDQLRKHSATIGDELAATHAALELSRDRARRHPPAARARPARSRARVPGGRRGGPHGRVGRVGRRHEHASEPVVASADPIEVKPYVPEPYEPPPVTPHIQGSFHVPKHAPAASAFDAGITSGTKDEVEAEVEVEVVVQAVVQAGVGAGDRVPDRRFGHQAQASARSRGRARGGAGASPGAGRPRAARTPAPTRPTRPPTARLPTPRPSRSPPGAGPRWPSSPPWPPTPTTSPPAAAAKTHPRAQLRYLMGRFGSLRARATALSDGGVGGSEWFA